MTQPSGWPERDEAALIPQSPRLERVPEDAQPASSKATFSSAAGLYDAAGTQARAQDARVDWSADLASRQWRPPAESRIHSLVADSVYAESMYGDRATQQAVKLVQDSLKQAQVRAEQQLALLGLQEQALDQRALVELRRISGKELEGPDWRSGVQKGRAAGRQEQ